MDYEFLQAIESAGFSPTEEASIAESELMPRLGMKHRYEAAQLMLGRSLVEPQLPASLPQGCKLGKAIKGGQLFGEHTSLWLSLFVLDGRLGNSASTEAFRDLVQAHWARGAELLLKDWEHSRKDRALFAKRLAELLPEGASRPASSGSSSGTTSALGPIQVKPGSIGVTHPAAEPVSFVLNGPGVSPHIALMGKSGSGKTVTGVQVLRQIVEQSGAPFLLIDPKGEFVVSGRLSDKFPAFRTPPNIVEVGKAPIPLDFSPDPSQGRMEAQKAARQLTETITKCCRGAGQIQKDRLRIIIEAAFAEGAGRDLAELTQRYRTALESEDRTTDSVLALLSELSSFGNGCFSPEQAPAEFLAQSWVVSLKALPDGLRPLCVLVLLDVLKAHLRSLDEAPIQNGHRQLRHVLMLDEARKFLKEARSESLVEIVREMRSKGACAILLSQDPSDFEAEQDDFTTQLGTVIGFSCNQSKSGLRSLRGVYGRALQEREFSDITLPPGVAFCKLPQRDPEQIRCWQPG